MEITWDNVWNICFKIVVVGRMFKGKHFVNWSLSDDVTLESFSNYVSSYKEKYWKKILEYFKQAPITHHENYPS